MPYDEGLVRCKCGKASYETERQAILCAPPVRFQTYECDQGWWHVTTDGM